MGTKSRETIYGSSIRASAERAAEARKQADNRCRMMRSRSWLVVPTRKIRRRREGSGDLPDVNSGERTESAIAICDFFNSPLISDYVAWVDQLTAHGPGKKIKSLKPICRDVRVPR
jgi:hypothetical protein